MKLVLISIASVFLIWIQGAQANPVQECFTFRNGPEEVTIGWFQSKTFTVQKICIEGTYNQMGFNQFRLVLTESGFSAGRTGAEISYDASLERFSATAARFTISDGEPEPTQWEATFKGDELVSVQFKRGQPVDLVKAQ